MTETSGRLLKLLSLLQTQRDWPGEELARRLEVSGRTIRRDVERLRDLGYPVDALTGPAGGYRLHAGTAMPPLLLDDDEAVAIAVGLRTAAGAAITGIEETALRALVKLEQVLPAHLRRRVGALHADHRGARPAAGPTVDPAALTADRRRLPRPRAPALRLPPRATASRPSASWSRTASSTSAAAGTWSPGTASAATGAASAWTGCRSRRPTRTRFAPRDAAPARSRRLRRGEPLQRALPLPGARDAARAGGRGGGARAAALGHARAARRRHVRVPHRRRLAGLAGAADRHARRRVRGPRAAGARGALSHAGRALRAGGRGACRMLAAE